MAEPPPGSTVGVVVCTHLRERESQLMASIASLQSQSWGHAPIVVVVDGDPVYAKSLRARLHGCVVDVLEVRQGLSTARNRGAALLDTDIVAFLDDDAEAHPDWIARLAKPMQDLAVLGASGQSVPIWGAPRPGWLPDEFLWTIGCTHHGAPTTIEKVRNVSGGCCAIRRTDFASVGGYDPTLGYGPANRGGGEEADLCLRMTAKADGLGFVFVPEAFIRHNVPAARLTLRYFTVRCFAEGKAKHQVRCQSQKSGALTPELQFAAGIPAAMRRELGSPRAGIMTPLARVFGLAWGAASVASGYALAAARRPARRRATRGGTTGPSSSDAVVGRSCS